MLRILYSLALLSFTIVFGWWIFFPLALIYVYLAKLPYEIIVLAAVLDSLYYFGEGFFNDNLLTIFSVILILMAFLIGSRVNWQPKI